MTKLIDLTVSYKRTDTEYILKELEDDIQQTFEKWGLVYISAGVEKDGTRVLKFKTLNV